jgi:hypothetical protein
MLLLLVMMESDPKLTNNTNNKATKQKQIAERMEKKILQF